MSNKPDKSAPAKPSATAPSPAVKNPTAAKAPASAPSSGKVQIVFDSAGKGDAMNAIKLLEAAGFEVSNRQVDANHNYMKHEDLVYVPTNLAADAGKALGILRSVRSQLVDRATSEDDAIFAWFIR